MQKELLSFFIKDRESVFARERLKAYSIENNMYLVEFSNPALKNALDQKMAEEALELTALLKQLNPRVLIFKGEGDIFSAGGDLNFLESLTKQNVEDIEHQMLTFYSSFLGLARFNCPTIAYINGHAIGAGLCFAMACDLIYVNEDAKLGVNFVKLGISPGMGAEYWLKKFPVQIAAEMLFSGKIYVAKDLDRYNAFNFCGEMKQTEMHIIDITTEIAQNSPRAIRFSRIQLNMPNLSLLELLQHEGASQADCLANGEVSDAIRAVKEKKPFCFKT